LKSTRLHSRPSAACDRGKGQRPLRVRGQVMRHAPDLVSFEKSFRRVRLLQDRDVGGRVRRSSSIAIENTRFNATNSRLTVVAAAPASSRASMDFFTSAVPTRIEGRGSKMGADAPARTRVGRLTGGRSLCSRLSGPRRAGQSCEVPPARGCCGSRRPHPRALEQTLGFLFLLRAARFPPQHAEASRHFSQMTADSFRVPSLARDFGR
jgi:hypothetical protein